MGRHKEFEEEGFDFAASNGWLSYYPTKNVNLFFGHGKMFSGHGYRSHHLSHQSFNYPHLKTNIVLLKGRLQVMWAIATLQTLQRQPRGEVPEALFKRKAATFSSLSYLLGKRVEVSIFESNIWRRYDELTGSVRLSEKAYVPVPLFGVFSGSDSTMQRSRLGANLLVKVTNGINVYGQYQLETHGIQAGVRWNDVFGMKGLRMLIEYNQADGDIVSDRLLDFQHFNENLGHPVTGEFKEYIGRIMYRKKRWNGMATMTQIDSSFDRVTLEIVAGFMLNPKTNSNINIGYLSRSQNSDFQNNSGVLYIGLRSGVIDTLFDF